MVEVDYDLSCYATSVLEGPVKENDSYDSDESPSEQYDDATSLVSERDESRTSELAPAKEQPSSLQGHSLDEVQEFDDAPADIEDGGQPTVDELEEVNLGADGFGEGMSGTLPLD